MNHIWLFITMLGVKVKLIIILSKNKCYSYSIIVWKPNREFKYCTLKLNPIFRQNHIINADNEPSVFLKVNQLQQCCYIGQVVIIFLPYGIFKQLNV